MVYLYRVEGENSYHFLLMIIEILSFFKKGSLRSQEEDLIHKFS